MFASRLLAAPTPSLRPVPYVLDAARSLSPADPVAPHLYARVCLDPVLACAIADAYLAAPLREGRAFASYAALCRETVRQFHFLVGRVEFGGLGVAVRFVDEDPYADAEMMLGDLQHRRLAVWASAATGNPHPYLSDVENDMFRAVHDVFGHAACGRGFDPHGEEAAWLRHSGMYSPLARRALATETRGQNCTLAVRCAGGRFPEQKAALLPSRFSERSSVCVDDSL